MAALQLIIEHGTPRRSPAPALEVWRDPEGMARGYVYSHDRRDCVRLPGLAVFEFEREGGHVKAFPEGPARPERIEDAFYRRVLPMALQARGCEVLHASAVQLSRGAVVGFCGLARSGKSTIAVGLSRRGYPLWANDALVFEVSGKSVQALPVPFSVRLRPDSQAFFGRHAEPDDWIEQRCRESMPMAALCVLNRARANHSASIDVRRLSPVGALRALLTQACCFTTGDAERKRRTMIHYLDLVGRLPIFEISFATGLQHLSVVLDAVEEILGVNRPRPVMVHPNGGLIPRPAELRNDDHGMTIV
jgi:hypothetical protein